MLSKNTMLRGKGEAVSKITTLLTDLDKTGDVPDKIVDRPGKFFREFYEAWYENGGLEGGKPRNSIRRMRNEWLVGDSAVPSLHPKLQGEVKLRRRDVDILTRLFLARWEYVGSRRKDDAVTPDGYLPFPSLNQDQLTNSISDGIFGQKGQEKKSTILLPTMKFANSENESAILDYMTFARDADVIVTVSPRKSILGPSAQEGMRIWWHLFEDFFLDEKIDDKIFVWVIDIGSRQVEDEGSFDEYYNAGLLALHFSAFANFGSALDQKQENAGPISRRLSLPDSGKRLERWRWLKEHAAVVVPTRGNKDIEKLYQDEDEPLKTIRLQHNRLNVEHVLPRTMPSIWSKPLEDLYKTRISDLAETTLSLAYKKLPSNQITIRYLAAADKNRLDSRSDDGETLSVTAIELPSPGIRYDEAYELISFACAYRLARDRNDPETKFAMAYLKLSGCEILRIDDYIRFFGIVESDQSKI